MRREGMVMNGELVKKATVANTRERLRKTTITLSQDSL
jgi:hypothetical protein